MSVEQFWQAWTLGFAVSVLYWLAQLLTERYAAPGRRVRATVRSVYLVVGATGVGLGAYELATTPAPILAEPVGGYLTVTVLAVLAGVVLIIVCVRFSRGLRDAMLPYRAAGLLRAGHFSQALVRYERLLARRPRWAAAWAGTSTALRVLGRATEALACAERAQALAPRDAHVWELKADALLALGRDDDALAACEQALHLAPRDAALWAAQGYALERIGRHVEARDSCERALRAKRIGPAVRASALATLATALNAVGRYDDALTAAEQVFSLNVHSPFRAWLAQAVALVGLGQSVEAQRAATLGLEAAERYLAEEPAYVLGWETSAALLRLLGRDAEAEAAATHARELVS
jgi:tetratricopeptide (TPR) repeat protein